MQSNVICQVSCFCIPIFTLQFSEGNLQIREDHRSCENPEGTRNPDDSTLVQHNISDGDTVRVLIEPERNIEVEVQCSPIVYKHEVNYCMTVKELKMFLIENNEAAFLEKRLRS